MRTGSTRFVWSALALLVAGFAFVGGKAQANQSAALGAVNVDRALLERLQANPTGGVTAIVTTWNRDGLDAVTAAGITGPRLSVLPMIITSGLTAVQLERLQAMPQVRSVWGERRFRTSMEDTTWITKARYVWAGGNGSGGLPGFGVTGRGIELAVIDTGMNGLHEDGDNLIEYCEAGPENVPASSDFVRCSPWPNGFNLAPAGTGQNPRADSNDDEGHGSHVSGTVAGTGHASGGTQNPHSTIGMSPHAKLRVYSANIGISLLNWQTLAAYDDLIRKKRARYNNVIAVNNSWGGGAGSDYESDDPTSVAIRTAYQEGIVSVFAASNDGPEHNTLSSQCVSPYAVCVAATTKPDQIAMFSSRGRPSQPTDTNRDGAANDADVQPDNHDWRLGQAYELGRYRPTLAAPGVNINSISANSACVEDDLILPLPEVPRSGCYEQLQGTSMAAPHVTGAIGLIAQAFRSERDRLPRPDEVIEILERSSNTSKLSAWDAEEQGYGRLDVHEAVKFARTYPSGLRRGSLGHPTPPYVQGDYPKGPQASPDFLGCTAKGSWTAQGTSSAPRYGQHFIDVPEKTERLRITVRWVELANHYVRLWRPGVNPDADLHPPGPTRTFADQESTGLLDTASLPFLGPERLVEVRSPEAGRWTMRVYNRTPTAGLGCGVTQETPQVGERLAPLGYQYDVFVEMPRVTHQPTVIIDSPAANAQTTGRWVEIRGRAGYPPPDVPAAGNVGHSWEGVTNWEVPGSARRGSPHDEPNPANPRPVLYFHGNPHIASDPTEQACTGDGRADRLICNGPKLLLSNNLFEGTAASWKGTAAEWGPFSGGASGEDRVIQDPNWVWCLAPDAVHCDGRDPDAPVPPVTIGGPMTVEWWASCAPLCLGSSDWFVRLWVDGEMVANEQVSQAGPALPNVPEKLRATIDVPSTTATQRVTVQVEPVFLIDQFFPYVIYYDSDNPCIPNATTGACDSLVRLPVGSSGTAPGGTAPPENVRVTDLPANALYPAAPQSPALRVAWDAGPAGTTYEVYRSTSPAAVGSRVFRGTGTACVSPEAPADEPGDIYPGHDRAGLCFTDTGVSLRTTYYYRVFAVAGGNRSQASEIAYNTPTRYDRQVRVKVDRLYGPQHWEFALISPSPNPTLDGSGTQWRHLWDTLELAQGPHDLFARSFTQGIGSAKATRIVKDDGGGGGGGGGPGCPDDDDGDGDDDEEDGDSDDDGDDRDDDCEDDDDDEEDEDD